MNKHIIILSALCIIGTIQLHSMEKKTTLDKEKQKEFRETLALCRASFIYHTVLNLTDTPERKAESRLRNDLKKQLNDYKIQYPEDSFVENKLEKLEKFKNKKAPDMIKQLQELNKKEDILSELKK